MNRAFNICFAALLFSAFMVCTTSGDQFDILNSRFSGTSQSLHGVAFGNGAYIAVGDNGTILYSTDSITWIPQMSGTTNRLYGVKYGINGFVAVGDSAPGASSTILNSLDGITWIQRVSPVTNKLSAICYGVGRYVAVGSQGIIVTSTNAVNWTTINTGAPYNLNGADVGSVYNVGNVFAVIGDSGTIMTSSDGLAWTARFSGTFSRLTAISIYRVYTGLLVAAGDSGTIVTSPDSTTWTVRTSGTSSNLCAVANDGNGRFGAVGQGGAFVTAPDGINWTSGQASTSSFNGLVYANGNFLAVGDSGAIRSGILWLPRNSGISKSLVSANYGNGKYVAVGVNSILTSGDGVIWAAAYTNNNITFSGVIFGSNLFVSVGGAMTYPPTNGVILTSSNGLNWVNQNIGTTYVPTCVAYGNGVYVAMGSAGIVFRSTDGLNWTHFFPALPFSSPSSVTFGTNLFVAISGNFIATSPDGLTWTSRNSGVPNSYVLASVCFGNGSFVAVGQDIIGSGTQITTSKDGTNWTYQPSGGNGDYGITYGDLGFVAPGNQFSTYGNVISTSPDGITWITRGIGGNIDGPQIRNATFGNGSYLAVGDSGTILQSTPTNAQAVPLISGSSSNGVFKLSAIAQPGYTYRIQISTNLLNWSDGFTFTSTQSVTSFDDFDATNSPFRFYRIKTP